MAPIRVIDVDSRLRLGPDGDEPANAGLPALAATPEPFAERWLTVEEGRRANPRVLDARLISACTSYAPRLRAQLTLMPSQKDHDRLALLHEAPSGAICKLIRLCPGRYGHRYPLVDWVVSPLPELCERERLALAVDYGDDCEWLPWEEVVRFARTFTSLPVLLIGNWAADAVVSAALDVTANLLVEVQPALAAEQLGALVRGFGSHRFVFGSARSVDADQPAGKFATDLLDEEDAAAILGGNAEGLESGAWSERFL